MIVNMQASSLACKNIEEFLAITHYNIDKTAVIKMFKTKRFWVLVIGKSLANGSIVTLPLVGANKTTTIVQITGKLNKYK